VSDSERKRSLDDAKRELRSFSGFDESELELTIKSGKRSTDAAIVGAFRNELLSVFRRYLMEYPDLNWITLIGAMDLERHRILAYALDRGSRRSEDGE